MGEIFSSDEQKALIRAKEIEHTVQTLWAEQDRLLDPIVKKAITAGKDTAQELMALLPNGVHKLELKTWLNLKSRETQRPAI